VQSAISPITAVAQNPSIVDVGIDQAPMTVTLTGKTPGTT
jgi:hypothetical protein